jgi:hypothetical protein
MSEHTHLTSMMRVMRDHVRQHGGARGPRSCPPIAAERFNLAGRPRQSVRKHVRAACCAFEESGLDLLLRAGGAVEPGGELQMRGGQPEPFAADVVDVREDGGDCPPATPRRRGAPYSRMQVFEDDLVHTLIYGVTLHQNVAVVAAGASV